MFSHPFNNINVLYMYFLSSILKQYRRKITYKPNFMEKIHLKKRWANYSPGAKHRPAILFFKVLLKPRFQPTVIRFLITMGRENGVILTETYGP